MTKNTKTRFTPPKKLTVAQAKKVVGTTNAFPAIKGKKHTYPHPNQERAWTNLINKARLEHAKVRHSLRHGETPKFHPQRRKFEYILHHKHPDAVAKRVIRNRHRRQHGLKVGDQRHVHHHDQKTMALSKTEIMTPCEHQKIHGQTCKKTKTKKVRVLKRTPVKKR
jgi:hypothetical protein